MKNHQNITARLSALVLAASASLAPAQLVINGATIVIENGAKLVVEGTIGGPADIDWPVQEPYGTALDDATVRAGDGEQIEVGIVIPPMVMTCVPGPTGPTYHSGEATPSAVAIPAFIKYVRQSKAPVFVPVDLLLEVRNTEAGPPDADLQEIDTEILSMSLTMPPGGHPFFSSMSGVAQPGGTGRTTLRRFQGDQFHVDSFFDVFIELSVVGAPGEEFEGVVINDGASMRLRQTLDVFDGVRFSPIGDTRIIDDGACLNLDNLGSSGQDGVSLRLGGKKGYDAYMQKVSVALQAPSGTTGLLADGESMSMFPHPPPPEPDFPDLPDLPAREIACTNTGGVVSAVCNSNAVRATEWLVEVWDGDALVAVGTAPDGSACWSMPAAGFRPVEVRCSGATDRGGDAMTTALVMDGPTEVTISGAATPVVGTCIAVSPRNPLLSLGGCDRLDIICSCTHLCVESVAVGEAGVNFQGLDNAVLSSAGGGRIKVSNLGSSGCDGVSISNGGGDALDDDCDGICLPLSTKFEPVDVEGSGGSFWISSLNATGGNVASAEYRGGGGGGGRIFVDYNTASTVCRVSVLNDGVPVGEFDVPITSGTETEVCAVGTDAAGNAPRLTGCGKLRIGWPWELSCLVEEFDRPVSITPVGGSPLVGDEIRLLAPGATAAEVESIRSIQLRASGIPEIILCGTTTGPFLPSPVLPPSPSPDWEFPGQGFELVQESNSYYTWDAASGTAVCANKRVRDWQLTGQNGNRRTYSATMDVHLEGVGGLAYSKDFELPGTFTVQLGNNPFAGQDVQRYAVQLLDYSFALPAGGDPDIRTLRVRAGSINGFPSPGDVVTRKIPECELEIQAILDILADFELEGSQGGPLSGGGPVHVAAHETAHVVQRNGGSSGGNGFTPIGAADTTTAAGVLTVSNIGSSGLDGVSIDLPNVESCAVRFSDVAPVDLQPGGVFVFEPRGRVAGMVVGTSLGDCIITRSPGPDSFFDIFTELAALSPTGTTIEVYDAGQLVAQMPGGATSMSVQVLPSGGPLSPIKGCGKLSGRSASPCDFIRFCNPVIFRVAGQPDVAGDEVRLLVHGVPFVSLSSLELSFADTAGDVEIVEQAIGVAGRDIVMGGGTRATDYNSSRSNKNTNHAIHIDTDPDDDNDGVDGYVEMRAPRSVFLPGQRQLWPLSCVLDPVSPVFDEVGASMKFEAFGTINGKARTSYGVLEACTDSDGKFLLKGDFSSRGNADVCISVSKEIDKASPKLAEAVVPSGGTYAEIRPLRGGGAFPLGRVSAVPELYEPPFDEVECSYTLCFAELVEVTLPGQAPVIGTDIEIQLVAPTFVSEDIHSLRISGHGIKPLIIEGIGTGPFYGQGLVHTTLGGAQIEEETPGDRGHLVVSNIGSSGLDGVRIDLDQGEGIWQTIAPLDLSSPGASLGLSVVEPCLGTPEDCEELAKMRIGGGNTNPIYVESGNSGENPLYGVVGTSGGSLGGHVTVRLGDDSVLLAGGISAQGGGTGNVIGCGLLPPTLINGYGLVPACIAVEYDRPMLFIPEGGGAPFEFDTLRICVLDDGQPLVEVVARQFGVALAGVPQMEIENTELFHLNRLPHQSLGVAELIAVDGSLIVDNLGSSGMDGVRVSGRNPQTGKEIKIAAKSVLLQTPPPAGGFPTLTASALGSLNGVPDQPLGESRVTLGSETNIIPLAADFSSLGAPQVRVIVCTRGGDCDDSRAYVTPSGPILTTSVCHLITDGGSPPAVTGCGKLREQVIPGGQQPPCFFWDFDRPFEFVPPGGAPGTGVVGDRVLLLAHGASQAFDTEILSMDLRSSGLPDLVLTPARQPDSFFDIWVEITFTAQEIAQLEAADYNLDIDNDGFSEVEEFIKGLNPRVPDSPRCGIGISSASVEGPTGELEEHMRISFEFDPDKQGVAHALGISTDLDRWTYSFVAPDMIVAPDMWRLVEIEGQPGGNQRYTYERTDPVGAQASEYYRHRGHVTILK